MDGDSNQQVDGSVQKFAALIDTDLPGARRELSRALDELLPAQSTAPPDRTLSGDRRGWALEELAAVCRIDIESLLADPVKQLPFSVQRRLVLCNDVHTRLPDLSWPRFSIASAFYLRGDYAAAASAFEAVGNAEGHGAALYRQGRWRQAQAFLKEAETAGAGTEALGMLGVCTLLSDGAPEPGLPASPDSGRQSATDWLRAASDVSHPDVVACRAWVEVIGVLEADAPPDKGRDALVREPLEALVAAAARSTHPAILALACRCLWFLGRRREAVDLVGSLSGGESPISRLLLAEAELELGQDTGHLSQQSAIPSGEAEPWTQRDMAAWAKLLRAEAGLLAGEGPEHRAEHAASLQKLARAWLATTQREPAGDPGMVQGGLTEADRIGARACAACVRASIASGEQVAAARWLEQARPALPRWESAYLGALIAWQMGDPERAQEHFCASVRLNPWQEQVRAEMGILIGQADPRRGLEHIPQTGIDAGLVACRAVFLAGLGETSQAASLLANLESSSAAAPGRLALHGILEKRLAQAWRLRADQAQLREDWPDLLYSLSQASTYDPGNARTRARLLWARRQADPGADVAQELDELYRQPGDDQTVFYRSLAAIDTKPERACADWLRLVREQSRGEAGTSLGPTQLVRLGDLLAQAEMYGAAHDAYCLVARTNPALVHGRLGIVEALREIGAGRIPSPDAAAAAAGGAQGHFVGALLSLADPESDVTAARGFLARGPDETAPECIAQAGELLCRIAEGDQQAAREFMGIPPLPDGFAIPRLVGLGVRICVHGSDTFEGLAEFREAAGSQWEDLCPVDEEQVMATKVIQALEDEGAASELTQLLHSRAWSADTRMSMAREIGVRARELGLEGQLDRALDLVKQARQLLSPKGGSDGPDR